jgi:hypothetical protein
MKTASIVGRNVFFLSDMHLNDLTQGLCFLEQNETINRLTEMIFDPPGYTGVTAQKI